MTVTIVCIDEKGRPVRIPERIRAVLHTDQEL